MYDMTAAHPRFPWEATCGSRTCATGVTVVVKVNDRGPIVPGRIIDLSYGAAQVLQFDNRGLQRVRLDLVRPRTQSRQVYQTVAYNRPMAELQ